MSRRRAKNNELSTIFWRDIPAQVTARSGGQTHKALLPPRFQTAIDRAATVAGLTETSAYVAQWRRQSEPLDPQADGDRVARTAAEQLEASYDVVRLEALVATGGLDSGQSQTMTTQPTR